MAKRENREQQILEFIHKQVEEKGYPPSVREICTAVGLSSPSTVHAYIKKLESKGQLVKDGSKTRALRLVETDAERLAERYPDIPMEHVPGNCDCRPEEPAEKLLFLGDCRVLICHGHTCGVKTSLLTAGLKAEQDHLDAFLFGHTHKPLVDKRGRTLFLNPGTVGKGLRPTYGILTVEGDRIDGRTVFLDSES